MSFKADVMTFDGEVLVKGGMVSERMGNGVFLGYSVNVKDTDNDDVDEIDFLFPPGAQVYFRLYAPMQDDPVNMR